MTDKKTDLDALRGGWIHTGVEAAITRNTRHCLESPGRAGRVQH